MSTSSRGRDVAGRLHRSAGTEKHRLADQGVAAHQHAKPLRHRANHFIGILHVAAGILDGQDIRYLGKPMQVSTSIFTPPQVAGLL